MKIISKFKDYYDGAGFGMIDEACVYKRKTVNDADSPPVPFDLQDEWARGSGQTLLKWSFLNPREISLIGFCGKIYPFLMLQFRDLPHSSLSCDETLIFCFSEDHVRSAIAKFGSKNDREALKRGELPLLAHRVPYRKHPQPMSAMFDPDRIMESNGKAFVLSLFEHYRTPAFLIESRSRDRGWRITIDPVLKEYDFQRVVSPDQAFQRIHQYLSGVLGNQGNPIPEVAESDRIEGKGFDLKSSFRAEKPGGPARKQRKNSRKINS